MIKSLVQVIMQSDLYENLSEVQKSISGLPDIGRVIVDAFLDYIFTLFLGRD